MRTLAAAIVAAVLAGQAGLAAAAPARQEAARFTYIGYMGGLKIGWAKADVALDDSRYAAELKMETGGMAGWFVDWRHGSTAFGASTPKGEKPLAADHYRNDSVWEGDNRFVEVAFDQNDVAGLADAAPHPITHERRAEIDPALLKGVLDPLSAIVAIGQTLEATGSCNLSVGVYDGRRRYQLVVSDLGDRELTRSRYAPYGGESRRCDFAFKRVAGFKKKKKKVDQSPTTGRAYFRRSAEGAPLMPVRIAADTKYGAAILHLKEIELLDPQLAEKAARKLGGVTYE